MNLGDRMKDYESRNDFRLQRKIPVLGRLDGKAFHRVTREMRRPWDLTFALCMRDAAQALCENIQGCQIAYVQSDEITILLKDWQTFQTDPWFDYRVQKMCAVAASIATDAFNTSLKSYNIDTAPAWFDARFWNVTPSEVCNAFLWRQRDAEKNSIAMLAQAHFSHTMLHEKNTSQMQDMLMALDPPINWNDCEVWQKRGSCVVREVYEKPADAENEAAMRSRWIVDWNTPIFSKDRAYIEKFLE